MELRLIMLAARLLDPRRWRLRVAQLGAVGATGLWVWIRAVQASDEVVAVRDAEHEQRVDAVRAKRIAREREALQSDL